MKHTPTPWTIRVSCQHWLKVQEHRFPNFRACVTVLAGVIGAAALIGLVVLFYFVGCTLFDDCLRGLL
jgi:hypothetical protein